MTVLDDTGISAESAQPSKPQAPLTFAEINPLASVELLRNTDFSVGYVKAVSPGDGWAIEPAAQVAGLDALYAAGQAHWWYKSGSPACMLYGRVNPAYVPNPNGKFTATAKCAVGGGKSAKMRVQLGNTFYPYTDTPGSRPGIILAETVFTGALPTHLVTVNATVPTTFDRSTGIYVCWVAQSWTSGAAWDIIMDHPSMLETDPGTPADAPPSTPTNVIVTGKTSNTIAIQWDPSVDDFGVTGYKLFRDGALITGPLLTVPAYTDSGLTPYTQYSYEVVAVDTIGQESPHSDPLGVVTFAAPDTTPPSVPAVVTIADRTQTTLTLAWSASADDTALAGYHVYDAGTGTRLTGSALTVTQYTDTGLLPDTSHSYQVTAIDTTGNESNKSTPVLVGITLPPPTSGDQRPTPPTGLTINDYTHNSVSLYWTAGTDDVGVTGYRLYRNGTLVNEIQIQGTSYTDQDLFPNSAYTYYLKTVDTAGQLSDQSQTVDVITLPEPVEIPTWTRHALGIAALVGSVQDDDLLLLCQQCAELVIQMVNGYTRGKGFISPLEPSAPLDAVIISAGARLASNPEQLLSTVGTLRSWSKFTGFTLPELAILNNYRVMWA